MGIAGPNLELCRFRLNLTAAAGEVYHGTPQALLHSYIEATNPIESI